MGMDLTSLLSHKEGALVFVNEKA